MAGAEDVLLRVSDARKRFGGRTALAGASCTVRRGSITGMIGPNGSGKSTLFNCIAGTERLDGGTVAFAGARIDGKRPHEICAVGIGRTFQISRLFREMTVLENLIAIAHGMSDAEAVRRAGELLELLEIRRLEHRWASELSYGQRKLVEIGRALMLEPTMMLLDEPFAGINPRLQNRIVRHLDALRGRGLTIFLIDHEMRIVLDVCDTVFVMNEGQVIAEGPPAQVRADPRVLEAYF
ncbi:MAG: ABC transporter ATP-binding protein [Alphaproteobacteria bacterium]